MTRKRVTTAPGDGERRAASGYWAQYHVGARVVLEALESGDMAWVKIADPNAGRVDDLQVAKTARIDAYQVKWSQYPGAITLNDLTREIDEKPSLFAQLVDGWRRLKRGNPLHRVVVHLITNEYPSSSTSAWMPATTNPPTPYHLSAFISQSWLPAQSIGRIDTNGVWQAVWKALQSAGGLSLEELIDFVLDCSLDFGTREAEQTADLLSIADLLFSTAADSERIIELSRENLLHRLGWAHRYAYRNEHEFPSPAYLYRPIHHTVEALQNALSTLPGGYLGVFGSPGSGKSTLLTQSLRSLPLRLVRYYAYVPESQDPSVLRGESTNFLHDVTLRLQEAGFGQGRRPDPTDRSALVALFHAQLQKLGADYTKTLTKSVILVDGLDHITREQSPERSLLQDLPLPEAIPDGVYLVVGSQTDELPDLPSRVRSALREQLRRLEMSRLGTADVRAVAQEAVPGLDADEQQKIFQLSNGHPLALIYLLKQLQQAERPEDREKLLESAVPYQGDIEEQYESHWHAIENDELLVHTLGLLSRVRRAIPMRWVSDWVDRKTLRKLQRLFQVYFEEEGEERWIFFHNSFRLFLVDRTAEPLAGISREDQHQAYHRELAERYRESIEPWRWETLYHFYCANETAIVVQLATQEWFREQVEALRPIDAIQTDVRLAIKAAGACEDVVALARLTLAGASLEQREWTIGNRLLPDLLIEVGEAARSIEHLRDGNRLRVGAEQTLRLCPCLVDAGLKKEGYHLFELAEPLEFLSGNTILDNHTRPQNLGELLSAWVQSAVVFRGIQDVIQSIRRIRISSAQNEKRSVEQASQDLQAWLLFKGALACCKRDEWTRWETLFDSLDDTSESIDRFFVLLRSAEYVYQAGNIDLAGRLLNMLLSNFKGNDIRAILSGYQGIDACLNVAELVMALTNDMETARGWVKDIPPIPLQHRTSNPNNTISPHELRFRSARLCYLLGESRSPEVLRDEAEAYKDFDQFIQEDEKTAWRQTALAIFYLARLCAWGRSGISMEPVVFLQEVRWIFDLFGTGWAQRTAKYRLWISAARVHVLQFVITTAGEFGGLITHSIEEELESRWSSLKESADWGADLQRILVRSLVDVGCDLFWAETQLEQIGQTMLSGLEPYARVEACESQAKAWMAVGRRGAALQEVHRMVKAARGVLSDKDYQLAEWVSWLGRINELEPGQTKERLRLMLQRIVAIDGYASGVSDAANELLDVFFQWSPHRAIRLFKGLLENHIIGHQDGMSKILFAALASEDVPIHEVFHTFRSLVLGLVPGEESELIKTLVVKIHNHEGRDSALDMIRSLVSCVAIDVPSKNRPAWYYGIDDGLKAVGVSPDQVDLNVADLIDQSESKSTSSIDYNLHLKTGECLEPHQALECTRTLEDMKTLLENEDRGRTQYFKWVSVIEHLAPKLDVEEVRELEEIAESRLAQDRLGPSLTVLSKRVLELGQRSLAWDIAERALMVTSPSGWSYSWDGGSKYETLKQLIAIDEERAHKIAIQLYSQDLGERFHYPAQVMPYLDQVLPLLTDHVPVKQVWTEIEIYLDELFATVLVEPLPELEKVLDNPLDAAAPDTPDYAIADLVVLHLDHPSFIVAQCAVRVCTALLLDNCKSITTALRNALRHTDEVIERALMAVDAASEQDVAAIISFEQELERLIVSPHFGIRLIASRILARIQGHSPVVPVVDREAPAVFSLHLPESAFYHSERTLHGEQDPVYLGDLAREISPLDIEIRAIAEAVDIQEDNLFYRAVQHFRNTRTQRTWLIERDVLTNQRVLTFLDQVGLRYSHYKPNILPSKQALAYVAAELYDGRYLPPQFMSSLAWILIRFDPRFILDQPVQRPSSIIHMGGSPREYSIVDRLPDDWVQKPEDSLSLLPLNMPDGRIVLGERTQLRLLEDNWPKEERISVIRAVRTDGLWSGLNVQDGHPPFARVHGVQSKYYLRIHESVDHLVVVNEAHEHETTGSRWLALNPEMGKALGWIPAPGNWFRWLNQAGDLVAESVWWNDGPLEQFSTHIYVEVGGGWLVLVTESGFEEIRAWAKNLSRGGIVWRSLGWHGDIGRKYAKTSLGFQ
ncbi:MAG: ATP-binding protein [Anaerolineales bacterium]|nr:ATP-binding protein [Anaerolineales bacterium]